MIIEKLVDDESVAIFEARKKYYETGDYVFLENMVTGISKTWWCEDSELKIVLTQYQNGKEIVLYGSGIDGFWTKVALGLFDIQINFYCDEKADTVKERYGIPVICPEELISNHSRALVVVSSSRYREEILKELFLIGFPEEQVVCPQYGKIVASCGHQYFDFFFPQKKEVFVDAGAYDGMTTLDFFEWAKGNESYSYVLEPFEDTKPIIQKNLVKHSNCEVIFAAAWDKKEIVNFGGEERGTCIGGGSKKVQARKIDDIAMDNPVTYIKMDIEGSELKALHGACKTIQKDKPRLAICVYHKPEDIIEIPHYLEELVPEYKFALRHYSSCAWETVLYAWVEE